MERNILSAVIIVTHNSEQFLQKAWDCLEKQIRKPDLTVVVDSGSQDTAYLSFLMGIPSVKLVLAGKDIGFSAGNNLGFQEIPKNFDYLLLLNPDAFLTPSFIEDAIRFMESKEGASSACVTGKLLGYDILRDTPTGLYDSTGIVRKFYGAWRDRDQGVPVESRNYQCTEEVMAICGALMFLKLKSLRGEALFDASFFMYKEDIDLSLRLRKNGWKLHFNPSLSAYHCRGWNKNRRKMPKKFRLLSAKNELKIHIKMRSPLGIAYSSCKYLAVSLLNL